MLIAMGGLAFAEGVEAPRGSGDPLPEELMGVDIEEHLGASLPGHLQFTDDSGRKVELHELLTTGKPTILTFNYSNCPLLCSVQLGGLTEALSKMRRMPGEAFQVITIVLDPAELPKRAKTTKDGYLRQLSKGRDALNLPPAEKAAEGWTFLVGPEKNIRAVADAVGFGYRYHPERKEYLHPAVLMTITPKGQVAQYVYGVHFEPEELEGFVTAAGLGAMTESTKNFILSCYHYEAPEGLNAFRIMQVIGMLFAAGVVFFIVILHLKSRLSRRLMGTS